MAIDATHFRVIWRPGLRVKQNMCYQLHGRKLGLMLQKLNHQRISYHDALVGCTRMCAIEPLFVEILITLG